MTSYLEAQRNSPKRTVSSQVLPLTEVGVPESKAPHPFEFRRSFAHPTRTRLPGSSEAGRTRRFDGGPNAFSTFAKKPAGKKIPPLSLAPSNEKTGRPPHDGGFFSSPTVAYANKRTNRSRPKPDMPFIGVTPPQPVTESFLCSPSGSTRPTPASLPPPDG